MMKKRDRVSTELKLRFASHMGGAGETRVLSVGAVLILLIVMPSWSAGADLSPAIQADLYLVQTEEYMKEKNYAAAQEAMTNLVKLAKDHDQTVPDEFYFKYAQVLNHAEKYAEASDALHSYLESAGRTGAHYREALTLLHEVSEAEKAKEAARKAAEEAARKEAEEAARKEAEEAARKAEEAARKEAEEAARKEAAARAAREMVRNMKMVTVPAGSYLMGSSHGGWLVSDEHPQHRVTIAEPFAVGVYEVTFEEWDACANSGGCGGYRPPDEGWGRGRRPVINVNWNDAQQFVEWLRQWTGEPYRLLSEAEWEYVARAGTTGPFHTGSTISTSQANYGSNLAYSDDRGFYWTGVYGTVEVGSFPANAFGLYDVHGNVEEWVEDCWNNSYQSAPSDGSAWERGDCDRRVLRGGAWSDEIPWGLRSAYRHSFDTGFRKYSFGFRVARTLTP